VARAMKPGSKVDTMLILEGRQGIGKSTALATLAGEGLHCDSVIDFASKEACQTLQGVWIFELPELDALLRHETSVIKPWHLSPEHETLMHGEHEGRLECDPWDEILSAWTNSRGEHPFTMTEVLESALGLRSSAQNPRVTARVSQLLSTLGFERRKRTALPRTYYYARAPLPSPSAVPPYPRPTPFQKVEA
jgi:predicted P-loop ATPase